MSSRVPYKQIRARRPTAETIIVYQAYNAQIANAAVEHQRLDASDAFSMTRMTWIKPSFYWCMYRAGWSYKDVNQSNILQITMTFDGFLTLLGSAVPTSGVGMNVDGSKAVRVQWDPERSVRLGRLDYRSLQLGISGELNKRWIEEWICDIKDVTEDVRRWKAYLDEGGQRTEMEQKVQEELDGQCKEEVVEVDDEIRERLGMDVLGH